MWWQAQPQFSNHTLPRMESTDPEAHAHSPRRQQNSKGIAAGPRETTRIPSHVSQGLITLPGLHPNASRCSDPFWSQHGPMHDPFTGAPTPNSFYKTVATCSTVSAGESGGHTIPDQSRSTSTSHDESMPDYSRSQSPGDSHRSYPMPDYSRPLSPASSRRSYPMADYSRPPTLPGSRRTSDMVNPTMNEPNFSRLESILQSHQETDHESQFNDLIAAFSPRKNSSLSGISAPSNTRVNSAVNTPPLQLNRDSAAAKDRASSYAGHSRSVSVTTRDPPPPTNQSRRNGTGSSNFPAKLPPDVKRETTDAKSQPETAIRKKPVGKPKGRKEGRTSEANELEVPANKSQRRATIGAASAQGNEHDNATSTENLGEGKRKRVTNVIGSEVVLETRPVNDENPSPTRKVSKIDLDESPIKNLDLDDLTAEGVISRAPLGELENRM